jgi:hypothetical protein
MKLPKNEENQLSADILNHSKAALESILIALANEVPKGTDLCELECEHPVREVQICLK